MSGSAAPPPMAAAGTMPPDPTAGAGDADSGDSDVLVTICKNDDGSYTVYAGDEPDAGGGEDTSEDDDDAMGGSGDVAAGAGAMGGGAGGSQQGQPADSIGAALKAALDILQADKSSEGAAGNADDQLSAGYSAPKSPTPSTGKMAQKY